VESREHAVQVVQRLPGLHGDVAFADECALHVVRELPRDVDRAVHAVPLADAEGFFPWHAVAVEGGLLFHKRFLSFCSGE
jgi:hypothetical protein